MILKGLEVGPFGCNCYIVGSESTKEGMIIDPGAESELLLQTVNELGLTIKLILITHGHIDHYGVLKEVKDATGAEVAMHADDAAHLAEHERSARAMFGLSFSSPPPPDRLLQAGDTIDIGDLHFTVIHTPGHSPGGICLYGHGVVFAGDTLFNFGIGRYDMPTGNYGDLMNSITSKLMSLPDDTMVLPGHGPHTTIGTERQGNPFLNM